MTGALIALGVAGLVGGLLFLMRRDLRAAEKNRVEKETSQEVLNVIKSAKRAHESLGADHDSPVARQLRERFTRDE